MPRRERGGFDVGRGDAAVVRVDGRGAAIRGHRHPHHAGISGAQMGIRAADRVYRRGRRGSFTCSAAASRCPACTSATSLRAGGRRWDRRCGVAGDGVGIIAGAALSSVLGLAGLAEIILEYVLCFAFGWTIFQALFMRDMAGGSYLRALSSTFISGLLSMNLLMAGIVPAVVALKVRLAGGA